MSNIDNIVVQLPDNDSNINQNLRQHDGQRANDSIPRGERTVIAAEDEDELINQLMGNMNQANIPIGVRWFGKIFRFTNISNKRSFHKSLVLIITFICYGAFHVARRPLSIVKTVLNRDCSKVQAPPPGLLNLEFGIVDSATDIYDLDYRLATITSTNTSNWCDWAPFDDDATASQLLGDLDSAFLFTYAIFMFFSGYIADRCNLRYFLSGGLLIIGILLYAFGFAYYLNIHSLSYLIFVQILSGIAQTSGWPSVISCIGNWFDQSSRGFVFGIWNANTYIGNIVGAAIAGYFVEPAWGRSFIVPGFMCLVSAVLVFLFLVPRPEDVHLSPLNAKATTSNDHPRYDDHRSFDHDIEQSTDTLQRNERSTKHRSASRRQTSIQSDSFTPHNNPTSSNINVTNRNENEHSPLLSRSQSRDEVAFSHNLEITPNIWQCIMIPGVIEYSLCLGFAKLVSYTFLYWLPKYISQNTTNSSAESAYLSIPFDIGGIVGGILAGYLRDRTGKSGLICTIMLLFAIPSMFIYEQYASVSNTDNNALQLVAGILVNGPYALITTAISADLGSRIKGAKAMATVAAIVDGTGSIGAAVGPLVAGRLQSGDGSDWHNVFIMLMASDLLAILCLMRITLKELGLNV